MLVSAGSGYLSDVKDLSQGGACVGKPRNWPADAPLECRVFFIFDQETVIGVNAHIVRTGDTDIGLEFDAGQDASVESVLYESRFLDKDAP